MSTSNGLVYQKLQLIEVFCKDICHASIAQDIEGAQTSLYALSLLSCCGGIFTEFITEALSLAKIMQSGYTLSVSTGSMLLNKLTSTSSEFLNCSVHNLQDKVKRMKQK